MTHTILNQLRDWIQTDIGNRGLQTDPERNLVNAFPDDFREACASLAEHRQPRLAVVTGFMIPSADPPAGETDGPLGALFLARALVPLGIPVTLITDDFCVPALQIGLVECGLQADVPIKILPTYNQAKILTDAEYCSGVLGSSTHLLAIERVGPSHSNEVVPPEHRDRCHTMRGRDITEMMSPAHRLFDCAERCGITTLGIGDGGNEIGMGKIPWDLIQRNIPGGGIVACRVATQHLIVGGVSNWGAYALAAGISILRGRPVDSALFDPQREQAILRLMVDVGGLVDGVLAKRSATVDGLTWEAYADVLIKITEQMDR